MFDPAIRPRRRTPWLTLVHACVVSAAILGTGAARADIAPPPRGGNGGGSSVAGANGAAGAAAGSNGAAGSAPTNDDDGGCAVAPSTSWSELGDGPLAAGMIGVGLAAFVWSRRRPPSK